MKVLIIDNFDSFTYNLYQYVGEILQDKVGAGSFVVDVVRNNEISVDEIRNKKCDRIIISPGPGSPDDPAYFGVCGKVITEIGKEIPVLGVCLGMQGIAHFFGGKVVRAKVPMHGKTSIIKHDGKNIFIGLPQGLEVMRYHSLVVDAGSLPEVLEITATVEKGEENSKLKTPADAKVMAGRQNSKIDFGDGEIMGLRHREYPIEGIQFHPESFGTEGGKKILENFLFKD